jgi:hypothetical protein
MPKDWSHGSWQDLVIGLDATPAAVSVASRLPHRSVPASPGMRLPLSRVGDLGKFAVAGAMTAALYVWPILMMTTIVNDGMRGIVFFSVLCGSAGLATVVFWVVDWIENRHWKRNWTKLPDYADLPYWR